MAKRERIALRRFEAGADSIEGKLFHYLNYDPNLVPREAVLRALKAFYLPWMMESQGNELELQAIAKTSIQELQYRIFQIQQRFLPAESILIPSVVSSAVAQAAISPNHKQVEEEPTFSMTLAQMRGEVDPADLDQVLDDF
ncbi:MAG: hypothetical protein NW224_30115 [Leptolyngbyaceae cyanobacterium bins.302]|nr:hypothetical protein [Leptolyngbyaceae cyanobacterium bins.302]